MYERRFLPLLSRLDPETAHRLALTLLRLVQSLPRARTALRRRFAVDDPRLAVRAFGLDFANPVGLAAGFDKNGLAPAALAALGFGHVEIGTVTPRPQAGRSRPRVFRLPDDGALVNRLGFPNQGAAVVARRLATTPRPGYRLGINVGPNAASVAAGTATDDYVRCLEMLAGSADYMVLNVSSPNTRGLRALQAARELDTLLAALFRTAERLGTQPPLLLKVAPDLADDELAETVRVALDHPVAGIIATNTTIARPRGLRGRAAEESGGLSGPPLAARSTDVIRAVHRLTGGALPIIGVGGVSTPADALEKLAAGAILVQLYTGLIYHGPAIAAAINRGLLAYLEEHGLSSVRELVDRDLSS